MKRLTDAVPFQLSVISYPPVFNNAEELTYKGHGVGKIIPIAPEIFDAVALHYSTALKN